MRQAAAIPSAIHPFFKKSAAEPNASTRNPIDCTRLVSDPKFYFNMSYSSLENADALDDRAYAYLIHGDFDAAIAKFTAVLKLYPQRASALSGRGVAERKKGDNVAADRDLSDASVAPITI
jgi:tetratricopeptide (TPR) repeat protein